MHRRSKMKKEDKTKEQLINELVELRQRIAELEKAAAERKRVDEALRKAKELFEKAFISQRDAIIILDARIPPMILDCNPATTEIFGYTRQEILGRTTAFLHVDETALKKFQELLYPAIEERGFFHLPEFEMRRKDGTVFPTEHSMVPLKDEQGKRIGWVSMVRDITERKKAEKERERLLKELEAKNVALDRFTYTVSHDLRSPLVTIQGFTDMVQTDLAQNELEKAKDNLKFIDKAATKMEKLLSDTLQLSRIGRMVNPPEDVPFGDIVQEALAQTAEQIKSSGVEISVAEDFPTVHVDRMRIAEVLVNLIVNSINYRGEQPHPKIEIGYRIDNGERVFFVQDNGVGIDKSQHEKVFDLFYQVDASGSKGTGAGLAIVKRIIAVHGGRIWIESEKGKGCTICFTLPVV
ncbi:hypothetical protein C5S30_02280 [ANME-1 cluster archaeon GoMg4]|nr:hypothetical protein [ANME-1 cluster archaeon GoMg4]